MRLLLQLNDLWKEAVENYVLQLLQQRISCRGTAPPHPSTKISISSLSCNSNEIVCIVHFYLATVRLLHFMDESTRFSAAFIVSSTSMDESNYGFDACWLSQLSHSVSIQGDKTFAICIFSDYFKDLGTFSSCPSKSPQKKKNRSKHYVLQTIFSIPQMPLPIRISIF